MTESTTRWPGTNTQNKLKKRNLMISIAENPVKLSMQHFSNPIKKLLLQATWVVLQGLKENWISLVPYVQAEDMDQSNNEGTAVNSIKKAANPGHGNKNAGINAENNI